MQSMDYIDTNAYAIIRGIIGFINLSTYNCTQSVSSQKGLVPLAIKGFFTVEENKMYLKTPNGDF